MSKQVSRVLQDILLSISQLFKSVKSPTKNPCIDMKLWASYSRHFINTLIYLAAQLCLPAAENHTHKTTATFIGIAIWNSFIWTSILIKKGK